MMRTLTTPSRVKRVHVSSSDTVVGEGSGAAAVVSAFAVPRSPATVRPPSAVDSVSGAGPANDPAVS